MGLEICRRQNPNGTKRKEPGEGIRKPLQLPNSTFARLLIPAAHIFLQGFIVASSQLQLGRTCWRFVSKTNCSQVYCGANFAVGLRTDVTRTLPVEVLSFGKETR